jgi:predicted pyridoxine 5'-phosphate oxidase superfamily flavin-nucleotide-binding protein
MGYGFLDIAATPSVKAAQAANGSADLWAGFDGDRDFDRFSAAEAGFIAARDSFYMATVSETGWPYVQHRGGPPGFLRVLDERTLGFADFRGNRQYISLGNVQASDRVSMILVDYPARRRLKLFGRAEIRDLAGDPALAERLAVPGYRGLPERAFLVHLAHFDWNCPQHIVPRFTEAELDAALAPVRHRLAALTAENDALREALAAARVPQPEEIRS